jgi:hypothetical protein
MALRILFLAAIIAAGVWLWTILFPSPEKIIRKRLAEIATDVSFSGNENPLIIANRAESLADFFSTNVEVDIDIPEREQHTLAGRAEITQAAAAAHEELHSLNVEILDVTVTVDAGKTSATASATVKAKSSPGTDDIVQPMKFTFQKFGRDWLITRVETVRALT